MRKAPVIEQCRKYVAQVNKVSAFAAVRAIKLRREGNSNNITFRKGTDSTVDNVAGVTRCRQCRPCGHPAGDRH